jgi:hypothetical protein
LLLAFGRTPLFTYVLHIYLAHAVAMILGLLGGKPAYYYFDVLSSVAGIEQGPGYGLPVV